MVTKQNLKKLISQLFLLVEAVKLSKESDAKKLSKEVLKEYPLTKEQRELLLSILDTNNQNQKELTNENN